jgi:hypothetical protein
MHLDTGFCNLSSTATEWHGTTLNMSFRPEIVDWLWQNKKWFRRHKLVHLMQPDTDFHNRSGAAMKWRENTQNTSFRHKWCGAKPNWCFRASKWCENTQNFSFGPKEVHWNLSRSMSRVLLFWNIQSNAPRYKFPQWVGCIDEMARNHPKHEFWT